MSASAATAAVSARKMRGPRLKRNMRGVLRIAARSSSSKPPSGPISKPTPPSAPTRARSSSGLVWSASSSQKTSSRRAGQRTSALSSVSRGAISGVQMIPHCSQASMALARRRSKLTRATCVRRVRTGLKRHAPISIAFCAI